MKRLLLMAILAAAALCGPAMGAPSHDRPALQVTTLKGARFDLAAQRGKWVIVNFWATWCNPCIKEMPDISSFVAARSNVTAIGLAWEDTDRKDIESFLKKHPVDYPIAQVDLDHPPADFAEPRGLPTTYVIAPDGRVAGTFVGPIHPSDLERVIGTAGKQG